jgi:hypothetical protein
MGAWVVPERRRSRRRFVLTAATVCAVLCAAIAAVLLRHGGLSANETLQRVRAFVAHAGNANFSGTSKSESGQGSDEPGSTSIDTSKVEGSFQLPDRIHWVEDDGSSVDEFVRVGDASYNRSGDNRAAMQAEQWVYDKVPPSASGGGSHLTIGSSGDNALSTASDFLNVAGEGLDLPDLLSRLHDVRAVSSKVLEVHAKMRDLLPPRQVELMEQQLQQMAARQAQAPDSTEPGLHMDSSDADFLESSVVMRLVHADDGRLDELTFRDEYGTGEDHTVDDTSMKFTNWGTAAAVVAPAPGDVDPTPGIEEAKVGAFTAFPVLALSSPPEGTLLSTLDVSTPSADEGPHACSSAEVSYRGPTTSDTAAPTPSLQIHESPASCAAERKGLSLEPAATTEAVDIGQYKGQVTQLHPPAAPANIPFTEISFTVDGVAVDATTTLPLDEALAALASIGPLDLSKQPIETHLPPG